MSNPIIDTLNESDLLKDIEERSVIIFNYQNYGLFDRDNAINKIEELRAKDNDISNFNAAVILHSTSPIPLEQATNEQLIKELTIQRDILRVKFNKKHAEKKNKNIDNYCL